MLRGGVSPRRGPVVTVIGGGLAGSEAAWQIARRGHRVRLFEMRPGRMTPAHKTARLAELVCSNSLKSEREGTAPGLFKAELAELNSIILACARGAAIPAGHALAVDRDAFSAAVETALAETPEVEILREEVTEIPREGVVVLATGPLTSDRLLASLHDAIGSDARLFFFDAISPIVAGDSLDPERCFAAARYGRGEDDYLNCPMSPDEYDRFLDAVVTAERVPIQDFEAGRLFEACLPIEELASRGRRTLLFGPLKPVGLRDPRTGRRPHAVLQLRREKASGEMFNLVGCQTRLKYPEQARVFRLVPALAGAEFLRFGSMHRNAYVDSPRVLTPWLEVRPRPGLFLAGQITGCEGYSEAAGTGLLAGLGAVDRLEGREPAPPPAATMLGALTRYIANPAVIDFQPMNVNFGLLPPPVPPIRSRRDRQLAMHQRSLEALRAWTAERAVSLAR
jgi:methylenetetrahydrofolate--tRNA-(uracil-5-)-methyltransferase